VLKDAARFVWNSVYQRRDLLVYNKLSVTELRDGAKVGSAFNRALMTLFQPIHCIMCASEMENKRNYVSLIPR